MIGFGINMTIHLLRDKPEYIKQVADWLYSIFIREHHPDFSYEELLEVLKERVTYILLEGDRCIGTVSLFDNDLKKLPDLTPWLAALYVDEQYRSRGYAKGLIEFLITEVKKLGYKRLYLRTETAQNYYANLGWEFVMDTVDEDGIDTSVFKFDIKE